MKLFANPNPQKPSYGLAEEMALECSSCHYTKTFCTSKKNMSTNSVKIQKLFILSHKLRRLDALVLKEDYICVIRLAAIVQCFLRQIKDVNRDFICSLFKHLQIIICVYYSWDIHSVHIYHMLCAIFRIQPKTQTMLPRAYFLI